MRDTAHAPDEDAFTVPEAWREHVHPRRGGITGPAPDADAAAPGAAARMVHKVREALDLALAHPESDKEMADAARARLAGEADPLGAAVVAAVVGASGEYADLSRMAVFADAWAAEHGVAFAAAATAELGRVTPRGFLRYRGQPEERRVCARTDDDEYARFSDRVEAVAYRTRALLAGASEEEHARAVAALADLRGDEVQRVVAACLVPARTDWTGEVLARLPFAADWLRRWPVLCTALSTAEQCAVVRRELGMVWRWGMIRMPHTLAEGVGPALAPWLAEHFDAAAAGGADHERSSGRLVPGVLAALPTDEAFEALAVRLDRDGVHAAALEAMERFPVRAVRVLAAVASGTAAGAAGAASGATGTASGAPGAAAPYAARLLERHVRGNPALLEAGLPEDTRAAVDAVLREAEQWPREAAAADLPRLLVEPPWTRPRPAAEPVTVPGLTPPRERSVVWADGERESWSLEMEAWYDQDEDWARMAARLEEGTASPYERTKLFWEGPEELVRPLLPLVTHEGWWTWRTPQKIAARFGLDALPLAMGLAKSDPAVHGAILLPFCDAGVAALMADWLVRLKNAGRTAREWFARHPGPAARALVPAALGKAGRPRTAAEAALRLLASTGHGDEVREAARAHGEEAARGVEALLAQDPLDAVPVKLPADAGELDAHLLPPLLLRDRRRALPVAAVRHVVAMLAMSTPDEPYPGLETVREVCDPASLAEFGWALFERAGRGGGWALGALAHIGDDTTVRRLSPLIHAWPGQNAHAAAVAGLDVLVGIGSDTALVHLSGIAHKARYKGIKARAQDRLTALAADLGLTAEQLADRLVPDFGLDRDGTLTLDYGPRRFTAGFDEQLRPYVTDGAGRRLKSLPKPGARDDAALAPAAHRRFAELKKDVRTVAADQIRRMEQAMVAQRRWSAGEFRGFFAGHPLLWHIARRLVWRADDGTAFRLAEDRTLAGADDDTCTLPEDARVGIAHPVHLADTLDAWAELFADYAILQPFPQLGRPVLALTEEERAGDRIARFDGVTVPVGKVLGLERRGWERGPAEDAGIQSVVFRPVPGGRAVVLGLTPGVAIGAHHVTPDQTLHGVWLADRTPRARQEDGTRTFAALDEVTASEVLADLTDLAGLTG